MMRRVLRLAALVLGGVLLLFILLIGPGLLIAPFTLLVGWWPAAARLFKAWHPAPSAVVLFALAVLVLLAGSHAFLRWVCRQARPQAASALAPPWRWKWTLCGFGLLFCTLVAICSLVLTTHQFYWMAQSSDPLFTDPRREHVRLLSAAMTLQTAADEAHWDNTKTREIFWKGYQGHPLMVSSPAAEVIQPVWVGQEDQRLRAIVLIPRHPLHHRAKRFVVLQPGAKLVFHDFEELPQVLAAFGVGEAESAAKAKPTLLP